MALEGRSNTASRIHVLGAGAVGLLFAAHLRQSGHPITLVLRTQASADRFTRNGGRIGVVNEWMRAQPSRKLLRTSDAGAGNVVPWLVDNIHAMAATAVASSSKSKQQMHIDQLIITTKTHDTLQAFWSVRASLSSKSTVVLMQNGMGTYEAIQREFYPSPHQHQPELASEIPTFIIGSNTHGCLRLPEDEFTTHHTAMGGCRFAVRPSLLNPPPPPPPSALDMLAALGTLPLGASMVNWSDLHPHLLLKLAANAVINPVTALTDSRNGYIAPPPPLDSGQQCADVGYYDSMKSYLSSACAEIAAVYARAHPHLHNELTAHAIEEYVSHIAFSTACNRSSMLQDITAGRSTEVDWINGYVVRLGQQHGVHTPVNTLLYTLVKLKEAARHHTLYGQQ
ncbi:2-dehydropantoate 2-reductase (Ketopantoate reductase) (KPA reductase) (KPR) [Coemansia thaxteri]|uniref:2-dehydropantoate 2-reductase n=1 Tax=Coemansia thaxteri TaxID=2663907 RepID=A0A9W8BE84_9FUNG|nr:2-dehydropantoate 2-reductase (Ketopantoate reductase) (KPA reductase) (KPR) [Coemansia thaxteri]KAJ2008452.1 2-dehydropantoate 2-reductase (Ketopantoate reductase) (KPA reductase) (KPR) [Coemansia thaxteri]KAJ2472240.1 2-dehydropantoate 2-reductase (Ketopantoate reductase) (KPA reductase) (KPR) [Coemansia sp. RSA 2322]KAJ2476331.1 2-dehydropantoate 2-reductase (Ketopantoate reductase) (KPA reductase) (KPR) [Coemansia sp. RSA 2320]